MTPLDKFNELTLPELGRFFDIKEGRQRTFADCPACGATLRSESNPSSKRYTLGVTETLKGWHCFRCKNQGNMVEFLCFSILKCGFKELSKEGQAKIFEWLAQHGFGDKNPTLTKKVSKKFVTPSKMTKREPPPKRPQKVDTTSEFRWEANLWAKYKQNLHSEEGKNVLNWLTNHRGITIDVINDNDLGMMKAQGKEWLVIPFKNQDGMIVNMKFKSINKSGEKSRYRMCTGCPQVLYGGHKLSKVYGDIVIVCEGEMDALALESYGFSNVVTSTTGAESNFQEEWLDMLEQFDQFCIFYDNDEAGNKGAKKLAGKLGEYRCVRVRDKVFNDIGQMREKQIPIETVTRLFEESEPFINSRLKRVKSYEQEIEQLVLNPVKAKGIKTGIQKFDDMIAGVRSELWVVSGESGHGKTTFMTHIVWRLAGKHVPVLVTSFEQRPIGTVQKLLRNEVGGDFTTVTVEDRRNALDSLNKKPIYIYDHYGECSLDEIIECMRYARRRHDVKVALIDHLGFLIGDVSGDHAERQAIESAIRRLATIAVQDDITIILICHPNNQAANQNRRVEIRDLKGASAIRQDAHCGIIVQRGDVDYSKSNNQPTTPNAGQAPFPTTNIYLDKCRSEFGQSGSSCTLVFDALATYYADEWNQTPSGSKKRRVIDPNAKY